jgi:tetratricopeptide (TPR) repeat protein
MAAVLAVIGGKTGELACFDEAFAFYQRTTTLGEGAVRAQSENARFRRSLADTLVARAYARTLARQELPDALVDCQRALGIFEALAAADSSNLEAQQDLSYAHYNTGRVLYALGEPSAAAEHYRRSLRILELLVTVHPENAETAFDLLRAQQGLAEIKAPQRTTDAAESR